MEKGICSVCEITQAFGAGKKEKTRDHRTRLTVSMISLSLLAKQKRIVARLEELLPLRERLKWGDYSVLIDSVVQCCDEMYTPFGDKCGCEDGQCNHPSGECSGSCYNCLSWRDNLHTRLMRLALFHEEMEERINNQELYLGGCCFSDLDPQFHCFECGKDFGKPTYEK